ncbi:MAG: DUF1330 domain-containing protein [Pseudomonadota bacterium]
MAKGYWIGRVTVTDPQTYQTYIAGNGRAFEKYGAKFLIRGGSFVCMEGESRDRNVVIEFESYDQAIACYNSPEYQEVLKYRADASISDMIIIEGYEG